MRTQNTSNVLIIDDDLEVAKFMLKILAKRGIRAHNADGRSAALRYLDRNACDLIFVGPCATDGTRRGLGLDPETLRQLRSNSPELPVIPMVGSHELARHDPRQGQAEADATAVLRTTTRMVQEAMAMGCNGFLIKPLQADEVTRILETHVPNHGVSKLAAAQEGSKSLYAIVGKSPSMLHVTELAERIAPTSAPVVISGESGTGKEIISALIHHKSKRSLGPYVRINCAALSDSLLESELFGHEKGAFTGAYAQRKGRFENAHGGTLLLDEITETPLHFQAKLLRLIEQQEFERVGGNENIKVDVRILSTTNKDLLQEIQAGRFRQDLYYRLSATRLVLPPLRQRTDDLVDLVWYFVNTYARESQRYIKELDPTMLEIFAKYSWPGNVRQLRNVVRTSLILGAGEMLSLADVYWLFDGVPQDPAAEGPAVERRAPDIQVAPQGAGLGLGSMLRETEDLGGLSLDVVERRAITDTLRKMAGNRKKAAEVLGICDRTLRERIRRYKEQECLVPT